MGTQVVSIDDLAASAPERIEHAVMVQRWDRLSFLHRSCDPDVVQRVLPHGLEVDTFDGAAWIGLVAFRLTVRGRGIPRLPWVSRFAEVNVRTYVRGPDGRRGIWFLSLDAARLSAVVVARRWYRIPYMWGTTRLTETPGEVRYESLRGDPAAELGRISSVIGLDCEAAAIDAAARIHDFEQVAPSHRGRGKSIRAARPGSWARDLGAAQRRAAHARGRARVGSIVALALPLTLVARAVPGA